MPCYNQDIARLRPTPALTNQQFFAIMLFSFLFVFGKIAMMYYLSGITAIITEWLKGNCEKPASSISGIIRECIFGLPGNEIIPAESAHWLQPPR